MFENGCSVWDNSHSILYVNMLFSIVEMIISLSMSKSGHERQKERALYNTVLIYGYVNKADLHLICISVNYEKSGIIKGEE